jgi:hypothetical protein
MQVASVAQHIDTVSSVALDFVVEGDDELIAARAQLQTAEQSAINDKQGTALALA